MTPESVPSWVLLGSWAPETNDIGVYLENTQKYKLAGDQLQKLLRIGESSATV